MLTTADLRKRLDASRTKLDDLRRYL